MQLKAPAANPINIAYPLSYSPQGAFATNNTTIDAIADDLKILLKTNWGERPIQYDFGADLKRLVFEPSVSIEQQVSDKIVGAVNKWMPFVTINNVSVSLTEQDPTIGFNNAKVKVDFSVGNTNLQGTISFTI